MANLVICREKSYIDWILGSTQYHDYKVVSADLEEVQEWEDDVKNGKIHLPSHTVIGQLSPRQAAKCDKYYHVSVPGDNPADVKKYGLNIKLYFIDDKDSLMSRRLPIIFHTLVEDDMDRKFNYEYESDEYGETMKFLCNEGWTCSIERHMDGTMSYSVTGPSSFSFSNGIENVHDFEYFLFNQAVNWNIFPKQ